ncbi:hypothetical protein CBR_g12761 [Chara braunii]|uniref:Uncharacterized protein n=1 Tax=Chara braunii TaxID=69332 RepID=A0A388KSY1_CHABU|nr:hypothetical protein CBR_g12761 [Chara braunii]|eukprot:GBG73043.1 hypothetical protein CBR_g12761 [Chara braunii]
MVCGGVCISPSRILFSKESFGHGRELKETSMKTRRRLLCPLGGRQEKGRRKEMLAERAGGPSVSLRRDRLARPIGIGNVQIVNGQERRLCHGDGGSCSPPHPLPPSGGTRHAVAVPSLWVLRATWRAVTVLRWEQTACWFLYEQLGGFVRLLRKQAAWEPVNVSALSPLFSVRFRSTPLISVKSFRFLLTLVGEFVVFMLLYLSVSSLWCIFNKTTLNKLKFYGSHN